MELFRQIVGRRTQQTINRLRAHLYKLSEIPQHGIGKATPPDAVFDISLRMHAHYLPYAQTGYFSSLVIDYLAQRTELQPLYHYAATLDNLGKSAADVVQSFNPAQRTALHAALTEQYASLPQSEAVAQHLAALQQTHTVCVTTAHQPCLFLGPLFLVYKIASTIHLCRQLSATYPQYRFVPVYCMGSEDHDFDEINHAHFFGQTLTWQQPDRGAVGRLSTQNIASVLEQLYPLLTNSPHAAELQTALDTAYRQHSTLAQATQYLVNFLFGKYGLLTLNPDQAQLKSLFAPALQAELQHQRSHTLAAATNQYISQIGYTPQAFSRPINLFYHSLQQRQRLLTDAEIAQTNTPYLLPNTEQALTLAQQHPERFSPNVMLRPSYQQTILPNIAYLGGGGEIAYWLQQKEIITANNAHYPVLLLRNSVLQVDANSYQKWQKLGLNIDDLFRNTQKLCVEYVSKHSPNKLNLYPQTQAIQAAFEQILQQALLIDPTLQSSVLAEATKTSKSVETLSQKILRAEKRKYETATNQIQSVKERLFPQQQLQERHDNFIPYYLRYGSQFIDTLVQYLNPLDTRFLVLVDEGS